jgi:hypothetical protein
MLYLRAKTFFKEHTTPINAADAYTPRDPQEPRSGGHWYFETAAPEWRSLHHVAGGHFYAIGEALSTAAETA